MYRKEMVKALAALKFRHVGNIFMESSGCGDISLCNVLYFVRGTGLVVE
jgi:predicted GTPase